MSLKNTAITHIAKETKSVEQVFVFVAILAVSLLTAVAQGSDGMGVGKVSMGNSTPLNSLDKVVKTSSQREATLEVTFVLDITRKGRGNGTVHSVPAGIDCGLTCSADFPIDMVVTLHATPSPGSRFSGWDGEGCSGTASCELTMSQTHFVNATFTPDCSSLFVLAPGAVDPCFVPLITSSYGYIYSVVRQPDDKILIGGNFGSAGGAPPQALVRLNAAGTLDTTFHPANPFGIIMAIALQEDGRILILGTPLWNSGEDSQYLIRLNPDGTFDRSFKPPLMDNLPNEIAVQPDGKIVIGGWFERINGETRNTIARLNSDGSLDLSFDLHFDTSSSVGAMAIQSDGKILIARYGISRFNSDGSQDIGFSSRLSYLGSIDTIVCQPNGKILVGGNFSQVNDTTRSGIARLNQDGSTDITFDPGKGFQYFDSYYGFRVGQVEGIILQTDGKIVAVGSFTSFNGTTRNRIARLESNGAIDTSFDSGTGADATVYDLSIQSDGKILIGGAFLRLDNHDRRWFARLATNGAVDEDFNADLMGRASVTSIEVLPDGKILVGGTFSIIDNKQQKGLARFNPDGSLDDYFPTGEVANSSVSTIARQPDGKLVLAGSFNKINGTTRNYIARINSDGSIDPTFNPGEGPSDPIYQAVLQTDGKILIGGNIYRVNGIRTEGLARLNPDGSLDRSFKSAKGNIVQAVAVQADGKILVGGWFAPFSASIGNSAYRLNSDGTLDTNFFPGRSMDGSVSYILVQPDGKILIGGNFTKYSGVDRSGLVRVNADGSVDLSFDTGSGATPPSVSSFSLQPDGKVIVIGDFTAFAGFKRNRIVRLNPDGSLDDSFDVGGGVDEVLYASGVQADGKIVIGGMMATVDGATRFGIARLGGEHADLTVEKAGTGNGVVKSSPAGIDCAPPCNASFALNQTVTLIAIPDTNSVFSGWSGEGCSWVGTCTVTIDRARRVTAEFQPRSSSIVRRHLPRT